WPLNYETQQQLFEYDQLSNEDQIKEDKIVVDLKAELNKLIESLDKNDQINSKDEDIEDFREFIYYRHSWVISNLINPEFQEKKYNPIEFVCPEGQQYENLTNNEPAPIGYELIPTKETIEIYIDFLSQNNHQNEASSSRTFQPLDVYKINFTAVISIFTNLIAKILTEDLEEFKDENKRWEMYRDWNKIGNIPQKTIDNMENNGYIKYVENVPKGPDKMLTEARLSYYLMYINNPINSAEASGAHFMITSSLLYGKVKNMFDVIKKESANLEIFSDRLKWLKSQLFANEKSFYDYKSLCLMVNFIQLATSVGYQSRPFDLNKVKKWEGKECKDIEDNAELRKHISYLRTIFLQEEHYNFIKKNLENDLIMGNVDRRAHETKFWLNDLYEHVFILEDLKDIGDDKNLKILAGIKALADGELKIETKNSKNKDLFKELVRHLDIIGQDKDEKLDNMWLIKKNKKRFVVWIKTLMKDELFKEIEIIKNVDRKGKKIIDSNNTYMEEQATQIKDFLDRLKEDKNNAEITSSIVIKVENTNSKNKKKSKKKKGLKNEGDVEEMKEDKNIVNIEGEEVGNKNGESNKEEDNKVKIEHQEDMRLQINNEEQNIEEKEEKTEGNIKEEKNDKEEKKIEWNREERKRNEEKGMIEGNNEGKKKEEEEDERKTDVNIEEKKNEEEKKEEKKIEANKEEKKNDQEKERRTHGVTEEKKVEKEEGKVKVNNEANSVKKYSNDKKTRRKNKSRKTKSNNPKKTEVKDKELLINAENETNENKEIINSKNEESDCLLPDSEDDELGFTNTTIENSLPNMQTELLDDPNKELNLNKDEGYS
uniref:Uncharacterized protein n=1 Tax=Meloidogyne javanica TaxID=6303 RepID=A0A915MEK1_MELJA